MGVFRVPFLPSFYVCWNACLGLGPCELLGKSISPYFEIWPEYRGWWQLSVAPISPFPFALFLTEQAFLPDLRLV